MNTKMKFCYFHDRQVSVLCCGIFFTLVLVRTKGKYIYFEFQEYVEGKIEVA